MNHLDSLTAGFDQEHKSELNNNSPSLRSFDFMLRSSPG